MAKQNALNDVSGNQRPARVADDLLRGADEIGEFIFGAGRHRARIYHLVRTANLPVFHIGAIIHARPSTLARYIDDCEANAIAAAAVSAGRDKATSESNGTRGQPSEV